MMAVLAALVFVALALIVHRMVKRKPGGVMDAVQLKKQIDAGENLLIVDLRDEPEFKKGHIAGAVNIPIGEFEKRIGEVAGSRKKLALICKSAGKSTKAHGILATKNIAASIVQGGMDQWQQNSFPTES